MMPFRTALCTGSSVSKFTMMVTHYIVKSSVAAKELKAGVSWSAAVAPT